MYGLSYYTFSLFMFIIYVDCTILKNENCNCKNNKIEVQNKKKLSNESKKSKYNNLNTIKEFVYDNSSIFEHVNSIKKKKYINEYNQDEDNNDSLKFKYSKNANIMKEIIDEFEPINLSLKHKRLDNVSNVYNICTNNLFISKFDIKDNVLYLKTNLKNLIISKPFKCISFTY